MSATYYFAHIDREPGREDYHGKSDLLDLIKEIIIEPDFQINTFSDRVILTGGGGWIEITDNRIEAGEGSA